MHKSCRTLRFISLFYWQQTAFRHCLLIYPFPCCPSCHDRPLMRWDSAWSKWTDTRIANGTSWLSSLFAQSLWGQEDTLLLLIRLLGKEQNSIHFAIIAIDCLPLLLPQFHQPIAGAWLCSPWTHYYWRAKSLRAVFTGAAVDSISATCTPYRLWWTRCRSLELTQHCLLSKIITELLFPKVNFSVTSSRYLVATFQVLLFAIRIRWGTRGRVWRKAGPTSSSTARWFDCLVGISIMQRFRPPSFPHGQPLSGCCNFGARNFRRDRPSDEDAHETVYHLKSHH